MWRKCEKEMLLAYTDKKSEFGPPVSVDQIDLHDALERLPENQKKDLIYVIFTQYMKWNPDRFWYPLWIMHKDTPSGAQVNVRLFVEKVTQADETIYLVSDSRKIIAFPGCALP